jgi:uncharacterized protein YecE (DUF72 family)
MVRIGTAGWTIPKQYAAVAPGNGSHLERYAHALGCLEINSSFYRSHRMATWARWASSTPEDFRFSVKLPKAITHEAKLAVSGVSLNPFFREVAELGPKLAVILVQLPPSLSFEGCPAAEFFEALRDRTKVHVALEPRHATWFTQSAEELMDLHQVSRVAADPPLHCIAGPYGVPRPGGWPGFSYFRLHGSPRTYYSNYDATFLAGLSRVIAKRPDHKNCWVIFDNTALGNAFANAVALREISDGAKVKAQPRPRVPRKL